ncbi:MAG: hypothetical protein K9M96_01835 [Deltaproteobacteria bacterium]|nr:hypothetical protein [Deltaproteobacteria bacterium]
MNDELREVLEAMGVWDWLLSKFPNKSETELLAMVAGNFNGVVEQLTANE